MEQASQMDRPLDSLDSRAGGRAPEVSSAQAKSLVQSGTWTIVAGVVVGLAAVALIVALPHDRGWLTRLMGVIWTSAAAGSFIRGGRALRAVGRDPSASGEHLLTAAKALAGGASSVAAALIACFFLLR